MCLAVPGRIESIEGQLATVDVTGVRIVARLDLLPEAGPGDYVLVHAGFAIAVVDRQEARQIADLRREVAAGA